MTTEKDMPDSDRLDSLASDAPPVKVSKGYSRFIRFARIALPLIALALVAVVATWPDMEDVAEAVPLEKIIPDAATLENELLKPHFESMDKDGQPFTVTAARAYQKRDNPELVKLEKPVADMLLKGGAWIAAQAENGTYEQKTEKLFLQGDVKLFHDSGYQLETQELRVDTAAQQAFSDKDVNAQGPAGTLEATGLDGDVGAGVLVFQGPAKMVLNSEGGFELGEAMP